jgi:hypothetical protein
MAQCHHAPNPLGEKNPLGAGLNEGDDDGRERTRRADVEAV